MKLHGQTLYANESRFSPVKHIILTPAYMVQMYVAL